jgi:hypothetical protein
VRRDDLADALAVERHATDDEVVEHAAQRVQIAAVIDVAGAAALLGRHVHGRAHDRRGVRLHLAVGVVRQLGDAEVEDLGALAAGDLAVGDQEDVLGLEVAVDDAAAVRGVQRRGDLAQQPQRLLGRQPTVPLEPRVEGLALEELHHDVRATVGVVAEVEDLHDAGIGDRGGRARFVEEALHDVLVRGQVGLQHLHRRAATEQRVLGQVHRPHPALTQLLHDAILTQDAFHGSPSMPQGPPVCRPGSAARRDRPDRSIVLEG